MQIKKKSTDGVSFIHRSKTSANSLNKNSASKRRHTSRSAELLRQDNAEEPWY